MYKDGFSGAQYVSRGFSLITQPGVRLFVIIPLLINIVLLSFAFYYALGKIDEVMVWLKTETWEWVQAAVEYTDWLIYPLLVISILIVIFYLFSMLANWIAAPFNGLLSEAIEARLTGTRQLEQMSAMDYLKEIPRLFAREWRKLAYYIPRALGCLLLFLLPPPLSLAGTVLWFVFNAWMMAVQYVDYPMDNHRIPFDEMLRLLRAGRGGAFGFGVTVALCTMVPVLNLLIMPVAVAGATALWVEQYRDNVVH